MMNTPTEKPVREIGGSHRACKKRNVPFMIDGAATCPPFERLKTLASLGADLFCVSGGKGLRGPQCKAEFCLA